MNASDMLDYALGQIEGDDAIEAAREIDSDPTLGASLDRLRGGIATLLDDGRGAEPMPGGLATRTRAFIEARSRPVVLELAPTRRRFRGEDLAVAATIFLASLLALTPAVIRGRERWDRAACSYNLQKVGMRMHQYAALNESYPFVSADEEVPHAGVILCRLNEHGFPVDPRDLKCPSAGPSDPGPTSVPSHSEVARQLKTQPGCVNCKLLDNDYAFHVGHYADVDSDLGPRGLPGPLSIRSSHAMPIIGDQPAFDDSGRILDGNSPNHRGQGQNVLFADGHTAWQSTRYVSPADSDLYLNRANRPAYGLGPDDAVLIPAALRVPKR